MDISLSLILQYTAVAVILIACCIWMYHGIRRKMKQKNSDCASGCSGCLLAKSCNKQKNKITYN